MSIHGPQPLAQSTSDMFAALHSDCNMPFAKDTHRHAHFGHFTQYAAGYYAYLYSRVSSSHMWHRRFKHDPLCSAAGASYRDHVLSHGGARDPGTILRDFLGEDPNPKYLVEETT